jgi:hypothetical protein
MGRGAHEKQRPRRRFDFRLADFLGGALVEALILAFLVLAVLTGR